jgi:hypothetical protein
MAEEQRTPRTLAHSPRLAVIVGIGIALIYIALLTGDGDSTYAQAQLTAKALVETGQLKLSVVGDEASANRIGATYVNGHGERYAVTGVLWALVIAPFYMVGKLLAAFAPGAMGPVLCQYVTSLYDPVLYGLCGALLFSISQVLSGSRARALGVVVLWAFCTMTWGVSRYSSYTSLLTCLLLGMVWSFTSSRNRLFKWRFLGAGICVGLLLMARSAELVFLPILVIYAYGKASENKSTAGRHPMISFGIPVIGFLMVLCLLNMRRFGADGVLVGGYKGGAASIPFYVGLWGLLLSSGRSLFLFCPPLLLSVWALRKMPRQWGHERTLILLYAIGTLVLYGTRQVWPGDWADWGPRYLSDMVPLLMLPLAAIQLDEAAVRRSARRWAIGLGLLGFSVQLPALCLREGFWVWPLTKAEKISSLSKADIYFSPQFSPIFMGYRILALKAGYMRTKEWPSLSLTVWTATEIARQAVIGLDEEMLSNGDFVSHVLLSIEHGNASQLRNRLPIISILARGLQALVLASGALCFVFAFENIRPEEARCLL